MKYISYILKKEIIAIATIIQIIMIQLKVPFAVELADMMFRGIEDFFSIFSKYPEALINACALIALGLFARFLSWVKSKFNFKMHSTQLNTTNSSVISMLKLDYANYVKTGLLEEAKIIAEELKKHGISIKVPKN